MEPYDGVAAQYTDFAAHCEAHSLIVRPFNHPANGGVRVTIGAAEENDMFLAAASSWPGRMG